MKRTHIAVCLLNLLLLISCGKAAPQQEEAQWMTKGARIGVAASTIAALRALDALQSRPSVNMGVFTSSYLSQSISVVVRAAIEGVSAQQKLIAGQSLPTTSETFALLQELGTVVQTDIVDILNRSGSRGNALNEYLESLKGVGAIAQRKARELEEQEKTLENKSKQEKDTVRELESALREAFRKEDYGQAVALQEESTAAGAVLAETESKLRQTQDILDRFLELLTIAEERVIAISENREILIAGLKVVEVPGIENFDILGEGKSFRRRNKTNRSNGDSDIFGTKYIRDL